MFISSNLIGPYITKNKKMKLINIIGLQNKVYSSTEHRIIKVMESPQELGTIYINECFQKRLKSKLLFMKVSSDFPSQKKIVLFKIKLIFHLKN